MKRSILELYRKDPTQPPEDLEPRSSLWLEYITITLKPTVTQFRVFKNQG